jgi:putative ATP-binding cassette transporter
MPGKSSRRSVIYQKEHFMLLSDFEFLKKMFALAKDFIEGDDENKSQNWLYILGILITIGLASFLLFSFLANFELLYLALESANSTLFISLLVKAGELIVALYSLSWIETYLVESIKLNFKNWLTQSLANRYTKDNKYLMLSREYKDLNPAQIIESAPAKVADKFTNLFFDFIKNSLTLVIFSFQLWVLGGTLTFVLFGVNIVIPGFLFWATLAISLSTTMIMNKIGGSLAEAKQTQSVLQAEFRNEVDVFENNGESLSQEKGEGFFRKSALAKLAEVIENDKKLIWIETLVKSFQELNNYLNSLTPLMLIAPMYFSGALPIATVFEVSTVLGMVHYSLLWFTNSFKEYSSLKGSFSQIYVLTEALNDSSSLSRQKVLLVPNKTETIQIDNLHIATPAGKTIVKGLELHLEPRVPTLIKGNSGLGKSTLFRIICGNWRYGEGSVDVVNERMMIIPQKPSIPTKTLKEILIYPRLKEECNEQEYAKLTTRVPEILKLLKMEQHIPALEDPAINWSTRLSGGERQIISIGRALLSEPKWLLLDEITSAMDEELEARIYPLLLKHLRNTTIVSIGHRSTIEKYHKQIITISKNDSNEASTSMTLNTFFNNTQNNDEQDTFESNSNASPIIERSMSFRM